MSLCGSGVFHTGTFVYLHEAEHAKNSHLQNMHKKKKPKTIKLYETHKETEVFSRKREEYCMFFTCLHCYNA